MSQASAPVARSPARTAWLTLGRGFAISIVQSANGIARGISAPLVQLAISLIGWRSTYIVQAVLMAAIALPLAGMFRRAEPVPRRSDPAVAAAASAEVSPPAPPL